LSSPGASGYAPHPARNSPTAGTPRELPAGTISFAAGSITLGAGRFGMTGSLILPTPLHKSVRRVCSGPDPPWATTSLPAYQELGQSSATRPHEVRASCVRLSARRVRDVRNPDDRRTSAHGQRAPAKLRRSGDRPGNAPRAPKPTSVKDHPVRDHPKPTSVRDHPSCVPRVFGNQPRYGSLSGACRSFRSGSFNRRGAGTITTTDRRAARWRPIPRE
jgi:hypothetical protein